MTEWQILDIASCYKQLETDKIHEAIAFKLWAVSCNRMWWLKEGKQPKYALQLLQIST